MPIRTELRHTRGKLFPLLRQASRLTRSLPSIPYPPGGSPWGSYVGQLRLLEMTEMNDVGKALKPDRLRVFHVILPRHAVGQHRVRERVGFGYEGPVAAIAPISQLKVRMRQVAWQEAVEDVIKNSHEPGFPI
jgi:hypothetical protein